MVSAWPSTLPQRFGAESYSRDPGDGRLRSKTEMGPGKVRRRSSSVPDVITGSMEMTQTQLVALRTFVSSTLSGGALAFTFPDPEGGSDLLVRFGEDLPKVGGFLGFKGNGAGALEKLWSVPLSLEVLP